MEPHLHGKPIEEYVIEAEEMLGQIAELEATCKAQSEHISKQGKRIAESEEDRASTQYELDTVYDEYNPQRKRIVELEEVLKFKETRCKMLRGTKHIEVKRAETAEAERDKLREAGQAVVGMWDGKDGACVEIRVIEALRAALGEGDGK